MGVFHLAGLGISPGVITVPLTYIYFLLKQAKEGCKNAERFFEHSGEEGEKLRGKPEALIVFTSEQVIKGERQGDIEDRLFGTKKQSSVPETVKEYLKNLISCLKMRDHLYSDYGLRYFYAVKVDINNFNDCYEKIYLTISALRDKEIHCNLIGGANQINISLMLAGSMTGFCTRFYYVFETETRTMHPTFIKSKSEMVSVPPPNWHEIPPFIVSLGDLVREFEKYNISENPLNIRHIKKILSDHNFPDQFMAKLRGTWLIIEGDRVYAGPFLKHILDVDRKLQEKAESIKNFSEWERYFSKEGCLFEFISSR